MSRPGLTVANSFANSRKCLTEQFFSLHWHGLLALGSSARRPMPHTRSRGLDSARILLSEVKSRFFMAVFFMNLACVPNNTMLCFSLSPTPESKLRTPRPMRLRVLGLVDDMMSPTARWYWKSLVFSAIITAPRKNMARRPRQTTKGSTV